MTTFKQFLFARDACLPARIWVGNQTPAQAWLECDRADWMIWLAFETEQLPRSLMLLMCITCVREALVFIQDPLVRDQCEEVLVLAERHARCEVTPSEVLAVSKNLPWTQSRAVKAVYLVAAGYSPLTAVEYALLAGVPQPSLLEIVRRMIPVEMVIEALEKVGVKIP